VAAGRRIGGLHPNTVQVLLCIAGFVLLFIALVLMRTRTEIRSRRMKALIARERVA